MLFVFDTNVLISAALGSRSCRKAFELAIQKGKLVRSESTFAELAITLEKKKLQRFLSPQDKIDLLANYMQVTQRIEVKELLTVCRDPKDNMLLALAVSCRANFLVTGDKDILILNPFRGTRILTAADFLKELETIKFD